MKTSRRLVKNTSGTCQGSGQSRQTKWSMCVKSPNHDIEVHVYPGVAEQGGRGAPAPPSPNISLFVGAVYWRHMEGYEMKWKQQTTLVEWALRSKRQNTSSSNITVNEYSDDDERCGNTTETQITNGDEVPSSIGSSGADPGFSNGRV